MDRYVPIPHRFYRVDAQTRSVSHRRETGYLFFGETGTDKELVARALHKNSGRSGELVSVNCAAMPEGLDVTSISLPLLSERREDIEMLVAHFLEKHREIVKSKVLQVASSTLTLLKAYPWPGNVRELKNAIERGVSLARDGVLLPMHLRKNIRTYRKQYTDVSQDISTPENEQIVGVPLGATLEEMEEAFVRETLAWLGGNRTEAAKVLGIGRRTLQRKLKKYNI